MLDSRFTREDLETLIESMSEWEVLGNYDFNVLQMIKAAPMPPQDHEAYEMMSQIKDHFRQREKEILATRTTRQEKAVFIKAKLMMARKELGIKQLFDMAAHVDPTVMPVSQETQSSESPTTSPDEIVSSFKQKLKLAEYFIKDMGTGVWDYYQKFLREREQTSAEDKSEK